MGLGLKRHITIGDQVELSPGFWGKRPYLKLKLGNCYGHKPKTGNKFYHFNYLSTLTPGKRTQAEIGTFFSTKNQNWGKIFYYQLLNNTDTWTGTFL